MSLTTLLGIEYPIIQGAMAQIATYELAAAVSNGGGLGIIASGGMSGRELREQIKLCREQTKNPFGVNLMLMMDNCAELVEIIISEQVPVVTTGAGTPKPYLDELHRAGIKVIPVVPNVKLAKKMAALGVDGIIAEGTEAGGHVGEITTMALLPQVVAAVELPVIAAGGIATGGGIVAALALGAVGVQMGTVFLGTDECPAHENFKNTILAADDMATLLTGQSIGAPVRSLKNTMTEAYFQLEKETAPREELEKLALGSLRRAVKDGDVETGTVMAGQICGLVNEIKPAATVIQDLVKDYQRTVANLPKSI